MENGHVNENGHGLTNGNANTVHMDYSTDFPSLPISVANGATSSKDSAWSRPRPMQSKNSTLTFVVPPNERASSKKNLLGNQPSEEHKRCAGVAQATGCRIELSESKDGSLTVIIKGPRGKIEEARNRVVRDLQTQDTFKLPIPKDHHRKIIGKEGSNLKNLELATGCQIKIPKRENASDVIEITGPVEGIKNAVDQIKKISEEESRNAVENIVCPRTLYPFIKGPDNEIYNKLTAEQNVKINIPPSHVSNEIINIQGTKEGVQHAAAVIRKIIQEKEHTVKALSVQVPKAQHRHIVGMARKGLQDIFRDTGVWVEVPEQEEQSDNITVRGDPTKLGEALAQVLARASSVITQSLECPIWLRRYIIGEKGSKLNELVPNRDKVRIDFDENGHIYFEGAPAEVKSAYTTLENEVNKLKNDKAREVLKIHPELHRHIIGNHGSTLKKIKGENDDLYISFPNKQKELNSDEVTVEGPKGEVQRVIKEIQELVTKHENEKTKDLVVEQRFHKQLIGQKGENISKLRVKYPNVNISFPEASKNSEIIQIRGDKKDVDAVAALLTKEVKDLKESGYQETVPIFKDCHKHIIGKGGERIRKIRDETKTKIDMPSANNSGDERILITGKKENVAKAVAELIKIQEEQANIITTELDIPVKVQARLLGGGRRLIQDIETECGSVHIKFPAEKSESTKVTIRGHKDDVEKAEKNLSALAKDKEQNLQEDTVTAKPEFHRFLIGKKGENIKKFRGDRDVRIMFPRETDSDKETIHLLGKKEDVAAVKASLEEDIEKLNQQVTVEMEVEKKYHKGIAKWIRDNQKNYAVTVYLPPISSEATQVTIKGPQSGVDTAKEKIEELILDLEHAVTIDIEIPHKFFGLLLGQKNSKVRKIEEDNNVNFKFPARDTQSDTVTIHGRNTKAETARDALLALVPIEKQIRASNEVQRMLKANQGKLAKEMGTTHNVNIRAPLPDSGIEEITIYGELADVEAAVAAIQEMESQFYEIRLDVPLEYHWKIQGDAKMKNFKAMHHKYGVQVYLPPKENPADYLTIQGSEEQAKACAEEILATVEEMRKLFTQEISLDHRYHRRMMGGYERKNLAKLEKQYRVEIMVPGRPNDLDLVIIAGQNEDDVFNCIEHLKDEEEDYVRTLDRASFQTQRVFHNSSAPAHRNHNSGSVVMNNAPWQMDVADFPEMGAAAASQPSQSVGGAWGGPRRW